MIHTGGATIKKSSKGSQRLLRVPEVAQRLGVTRARVGQMVEEGKLVPVAEYGDERVFRVFRESDVDKLAQERLAGLIQQVQHIKSSSR